MTKKQPVKLTYSPSEGGVRSIFCESDYQAKQFVKNNHIGWHRISTLDDLKEEARQIQNDIAVLHAGQVERPR